MSNQGFKETLAVPQNHQESNASVYKVITNNIGLLNDGLLKTANAVGMIDKRCERLSKTPEEIAELRGRLEILEKTIQSHGKILSDLKTTVMELSRGEIRHVDMSNPPSPVVKPNLPPTPVSVKRVLPPVPIVQRRPFIPPRPVEIVKVSEVKPEIKQEVKPEVVESKLLDDLIKPEETNYLNLNIESEPTPIELSTPRVETTPHVETAPTESAEPIETTEPIEHHDEPTEPTQSTQPTEPQMNIDDIASLLNVNVDSNDNVVLSDDDIPQPKKPVKSRKVKVEEEPKKRVVKKRI